MKAWSLLRMLRPMMTTLLEFSLLSFQKMDGNLSQLAVISQYMCMILKQKG